MNTLSKSLLPSLDDIVDMDNLLDNKLFYLIYVDGDHNLSLKGPFNHAHGKIPAGKDEGLRNHVRKKGYRCISHLWGVPDKKELSETELGEHKEKYVWKTDNKRKNGSEYHHRIEGITWDVETRLEKRKKLLQIFNKYPGYWWMDNLCIDQSKDEKPINIMGDIYRKCKGCICMLDYEWEGDEKKVVNCGTGSSRYIKKEAMRYLTKIFKCKWFTRVWTFQEWSLSRKVLYTTETSETFLILKRDKLVMLPMVLRDFDDENKSTKWISMLNDLYKPETIISHLITTKRTCFDKRDYYNGISGLLGITLSGYETFDEVEEEFFRLYKKEKGIELTRKPEYREGSFYKSINWGDRRIAGLSKGKFISLDQPGEPKEPRALRRDEYF